MAAISKVNRRKKTNRFLTGMVVVVLALILVGSSMIMRKFVETETYYTLKQDIPAHTRTCWSQNKHPPGLSPSKI